MEARDTFEGSFMDAGVAAVMEEKWKPFLEGVDGVQKRRTTAQLMQNEMVHLQRLVQKESTLAYNAGEFTKFVFPLIRKVFPNLIAQNLVSLQPELAFMG